MARILIAGAGLGGLTAGLCLKQAGHDVKVPFVAGRRLKLLRRYTGFAQRAEGAKKATTCSAPGP